MVNVFMLKRKSDVPSMVVRVYHRLRRSMFLDKTLHFLLTPSGDDFTMTLFSSRDFIPNTIVLSTGPCLKVRLCGGLLLSLPSAKVSSTFTVPLSFLSCIQPWRIFCAIVQAVDCVIPRSLASLRLEAPLGGMSVETWRLAISVKESYSFSLPFRF